MVLTIYGDSISTEGIADGGYVRYLPELLGAETIYNHAVWGSGMTKGIPGSLVDVLENPDHLHPDSDSILIWHGTNDWYWGSPLGAYGEPETFCGGISLCIGQIRKCTPRGVIVYVTPLFRFGESSLDDGKGEAYMMPNKAGCTMQDYRGVILQAAADFDFKIIDMYTLSGINADNHTSFLSDGIHPNQRGCERIAQIISREILALAGEGS